MRPSRGLLPSAERAALLECLWRQRLLRCADTKSTFIVLALKLPLERNIHSLPQPAGPVKVANGGHLSGTEIRLYVEVLPREPVPAGQYLVHNNVTPTRPLGLNSFRARIQTKADNLVECRCDFGGCKHSMLHKLSLSGGDVGVDKRPDGIRHRRRLLPCSVGTLTINDPAPSTPCWPRREDVDAIS